MTPKDPDQASSSATAADLQKETLPSTPCLIVQGEILSADKWMMSMEGTIVMGPHNNLLNGATFAAYYVFNLQYLKMPQALLNLSKGSTANSSGSSATIPSATPSTSSSGSVRGASGTHPVEAEVSRLFAAYNNQSRTRRPARNTHTLSTYTHTFCCLGRKDASTVPSRVGKDQLQRLGLGDKRLVFRGNQDSSADFMDFILSTYPEMRDAGGFELLKISGTTHNRNLSLIPCPNQGYSVRYLKDPAVFINNSTIYIRPLQRNLNMENVLNDEPVDAQPGPSTECLICGEKFPFSQIRSHSDACSRQSQGEIEMQNEDAAVPTTSTTCASTSQDQVINLDNQEAGTDQDLFNNSPTACVLGKLDFTVKAWVTEPNPDKSAQLYVESALEEKNNNESLNFNLNLRESLEDRNRASIHFYKKPKVLRRTTLQVKQMRRGLKDTGVWDFFLAPGQMASHSCSLGPVIQC
ncbi:uncharacterized protein LOC131548308 isoform X3 [Onychostoma macrolepis]|uniref:uncharacterized protein LOC131548308 isoform X3 n=1 Tax=Onychostoma macrolepis TaxID=369639 RepID=UPI00272B4B5E|nr:uncharacterized protein LOC131548308 isoform X3 [Onychostoma macrolepis]